MTVEELGRVRTFTYWLLSEVATDMSALTSNDPENLGRSALLELEFSEYVGVLSRMILELAEDVSA